MARQRRSWTTKTEKALVCETLELANVQACASLGFKRGSACHLVWSSSQHGYVIYNEAGTKMIADR